MDHLRAIAAGLFVFAGVLATVAAINASDGFGERGWLAKIVILMAAALLIPTAVYFFNRKGASVLGHRPPGEQIADLERRDLVVDTAFTITRAFGVHDYGDEGPHYFLELADGSGILVLCGQYLYGLEPISDDPEQNQSRQFPCTSFTVRRHRDGYALEVVCGGDVIEPEVMAPAAVIEAWIEDGFAPLDGDVLTDVGFDKLMRLRAASPR